MGQNLGLSVEAVTQHSQRLFSKSEELDQALKDVLQKLESLMENGVTYKDKQSSKDFYEQINVKQKTHKNNFNNRNSHKRLQNVCSFYFLEA